MSPAFASNKKIFLRQCRSSAQRKIHKAAYRYIAEFFLGRRACGLYGNLLSSDNRGIIAYSPAFVKGFVKKSLKNFKNAVKGVYLSSAAWF
jgi:hypothetical protein